MEPSDVVARTTDRRVAVRAAAVGDADVPVGAVTHLAADPSVAVRTALAERSDVPAEVLRALARDLDRRVREAVARNPTTPQDVLLDLVGDAVSQVRWTVVDHPAAGVVVRQAVCRSADDALRGLLAEAPDLEPEIIAALLVDPSAEVRERLATHTNEPRALAALVSDPVPRVRKGAALNPATNPAQRRALARDRSAVVRSCLVRTVSLEEADLQRLVRDRSVEVRWWLAASTVTPQHIRAALRDDPDSSVAQEAQRPAQYTPPP